MKDPDLALALQMSLQDTVGGVPTVSEPLPPRVVDEIEDRDIAQAIEMSLEGTGRAGFPNVSDTSQGVEGKMKDRDLAQAIQMSLREQDKLKKEERRERNLYSLQVGFLHHFHYYEYHCYY
jgi:hypothetical protein